MSIGWFLCPYIRDDGPLGRPGRTCAMDIYTATIAGDGGAWSETEVLGDIALVKVRASDTTLATIASAVGFVRVLAKTALANSLSDLTAVQRTAITNKLLVMGYEQTEINAAMGNTLALWRAKTFGDLLSLIATRRRKPRYDAQTDTILLDGDAQTCRPVSSVDAEVV